jgi:hypothetical protein
VNKIHNLSYFKKRLRGANVDNKDVVPRYKDEPRKWTVLVGKNELLCTCVKEKEDFCFVLWDCGIKLFSPVVLRTKSMNVVVAEINKLDASVNSNPDGEENGTKTEQA